VLRRSSYLLMALSMLLIKYYPEIGKQYEFWTGENHYVGVATSKNMLGVACLIAGLFFFWDTVLRWPDRRRRRTKKVIAINSVFLLMALWQLHQAASATSTVCLAMGCTIIAAANSKLSQRNPRFLEVLIPSGIAAYFLLTYGFDLNINSLVTSAVGRDSSFTGRTNIWSAVLSTHTNPLLGTGYESFWLGWRLEQVWKLAGHYNESHDGYLEMYLNLGCIGLAILFWLLIGSFWQICNRTAKVLVPHYSFALALWTVLLFYNVTEAAFKGQLIWIIFLLVTIAAPAPAARSVSAAKARAAARREAAQQPALTA
jgi:exopolysaccharide production protein ExoQ